MTTTPSPLGTVADFEIPATLDDLGRQAAEALVRVVREAFPEGTGDGCRAFHEPVVWEKRQGDPGEGALLVVCYKGGILEEFLAEGAAGFLRRRVDAALADLGLYVSDGASWWSAVYPLVEDELDSPAAAAAIAEGARRSSEAAERGDDLVVDPLPREAGGAGVHTATPRRAARPLPNIALTFPVDEERRGLDLDSGARRLARGLVLEALQAMPTGNLSARERALREAMLATDGKG